MMTTKVWGVKPLATTMGGGINRSGVFSFIQRLTYTPKSLISAHNPQTRHGRLLAAILKIKSCSAEIRLF